jgi:hypothetical protein
MEIDIFHLMLPSFSTGRVRIPFFPSSTHGKPAFHMGFINPDIYSIGKTAR